MRVVVLQQSVVAVSLVLLLKHVLVLQQFHDAVVVVFGHVLGAFVLLESHVAVGLLLQ